MVILWHAIGKNMSNADSAIVKSLAGPYHQQPRAIARRDRPQRDSLGRQIEVEQVRAHAIRLAD